jgi:hypothetical protein
MDPTPSEVCMAHNKNEWMGAKYNCPYCKIIENSKKLREARTEIKILAAQIRAYEKAAKDADKIRQDVDAWTHGGHMEVLMSDEELMQTLTRVNPEAAAEEIKELREQIKSMRETESGEKAHLQERIDELKKWKTTIEDFLGQRGVENIRAMLTIIEAAKRWVYWRARGCVYDDECGARDKLSHAVNIYDCMVEGRTKDEA